MIIKKIINNNVVTTMDDNREEIIVSGIGIAFQKKCGDLIDPQKIEKTYFLQNAQRKKFYQLLERTPHDLFELTTEIVETAKKQLGVEIQDSLIISLSEHFAFAIERVEQKIALPNMILNETRLMYPKEFSIGEWAREKAAEQLGIELPVDESGYIALHLISASAGLPKNEATITIEYIHEMVVGYTEIFDITQEELSKVYDRFVIHLKFLVHRIQLKKSHVQSIALDDIYAALLEKDKGILPFIERTEVLTKMYFDYELSEQEKVYILTHVLKILNETNNMLSHT